MARPVDSAVAQPGDGVLVQRTRNGDTSAFDALVERYMRQAFSVAYRLMGHREDAEDLVQEAFLLALDKLDLYDESRPFKPWLFQVLVNRGLDLRKSRQRKETVQIPGDAAAPGPSPARDAEQSQTRDRVRAALSELSERDRAIVMLFEFEGLNSNEIGQVVGVAPGTVRWKLHQARKKLGAALATFQERSDR